MTSYFWCNLCYCGASNLKIHYRGKKHNHRLKILSKRLIHLPDILKFKLMSYLNNKIIDHRSLFREIHFYSMKQCMYEMYMFSAATTLCKVCKMPKDSFSYDSFVKNLSKNEMCIDCAFHIVTNSNFLMDLSLSITDNRIKLIPEQLYNTLDLYYRFERVMDMLKKLKIFYNRNNFTIPLFDITLISSFWSLQDFLSYIYYTSFNYLNVVSLYSYQPV